MATSRAIQSEPRKPLSIWCVARIRPFSCFSDESYSTAIEKSWRRSTNLSTNGKRSRWLRISRLNRPETGLPLRRSKQGFPPAYPDMPFARPPRLKQSSFDMKCVPSRSRQLTMLDSPDPGARLVARFHHCLDFSISSCFVRNAADAALGRRSAACSFSFWFGGIIAAAESSSSRTMQPLDIERQSTRLKRSRWRMPFISPRTRCSLNCARVAEA